jgi:hypothetical protein
LSALKDPLNPGLASTPNPGYSVIFATKLNSGFRLERLFVLRCGPWSSEVDNLREVNVHNANVLKKFDNPIDNWQGLNKTYRQFTALRIGSLHSACYNFQENKDDAKSGTDKKRRKSSKTRGTLRKPP